MPSSKSTDPQYWRDYSVAIFAAVVAALLIRVYFFEAYKIPTSIMRPTLEPGDSIFAAKYPYRIGKAKPRYGEIIIYENALRPENLVKRVVGLPGDRVQLTQGRLKLNGQILNFEAGASSTCGIETHISRTATLAGERADPEKFPVCLEPPLFEAPEVKVREGQVYVLGDTRTQQKGKNAGELISVTAIRARAAVVWLSIDPKPNGQGGGLIPRFRFDRMFKQIR